MEEFQYIQGLLDKIRSTGMGGISADDPQAVSKLEKKLEKLEASQELMKAVNAYYRKHGTLLAYAVELTGTQGGTIRGNLYELDYQQHFRHVVEASQPVSVNRLFYEHGTRDIPDGQYFDGSPDRVLGNFLRYEAQPHDPAVLQEALRQEQHSRGRAVPGDFKAHVTALHDSRIETEARRIVDKLKDLSAPNSPNKTHFMVEISPHFDALASTKDNDRLFAMLPYKSLCFTSIKDRHGVYAMINKDERRDVSIRKPRPSIRKQLADSKQATSPKKAAARTKKNELEV